MAVFRALDFDRDEDEAFRAAGFGRGGAAARDVVAGRGDFGAAARRGSRTGVAR